MRSLPVFRQNFRGLSLVLGLALLLAACASRPENGALLINDKPAADATTHDILIATTRERDERPGTYFNGERTQRLDYAEAVISVPPAHKASQIEWPETFPGDPEKEFVTRSAHYIDGQDAFRARLNQRLGKLPTQNRTTFLFIHGYNTLFAEGLYRFTQFVHDANFPGVPVFFTWASRGKLTDYVYDLNSALAARSALEKALIDISRSNTREIVILAHSMGNQLLMETIRQMTPKDREALFRKIETVVLASPDIDIDVFKEQLRRIGKLREPLIILTSSDDKALRVSEVIAGGKQRVGSYADDKELADLGAIVLNLTELSAPDSINHSKFAELAQYAPELRSVLSQRSLGAQSTSGNGLQQSGTDLKSFVTSTAQVAITLPISLVTAPLSLVTGGN
ncbi:alpha/beta hydrolase [Roseibium suaedae]|uniref:Esterase/lipase superfamily enzyme n=1 Tax=Roseibium suaedae TaxID=735517 RepID=A0A1M7CNI2_9HYPH|nr:alpha/beta hydrolase [Roseibium suaedae]SHL68765.1 Esterase/lipase superfamily enzyme [Roseibium suaedae]